MGLFKSHEEKMAEFRQRVDMLHGRICVSFSSGAIQKDLLGVEQQINNFLLDYPEYKIVSMAAAVGIAGTVICYFEKTESEITPNAAEMQDDKYQEIEKLYNLKMKGIISEEEFSTKKKELLALKSDCVTNSTSIFKSEKDSRLGSIDELNASSDFHNISDSNVIEIMEPTDGKHKTILFKHRPENKIICPLCGENQQSDRRVCWACGARFKFQDEI